MSMQLIVNPADGLPIYRQIMRQITEAIAGGRLKAGDQLASHRDLSEQLVIAPLTVKKAYDEPRKRRATSKHSGDEAPFCLRSVAARGSG